MYRKTVPMLLLSSIICSSSFAIADDVVQPTTDVYTLGEIVVSSTDERNVESIATNREITSLDIERQHVRTLDEALKLVPGVYVRNGAQGIPRVDIRGMRSRHVVLLLNGVPINSTYDGQFDPSMISVEKIAKIKVSYGNSSVLYDQGGLGGVINIITKKGTQGLHGTASAELDENGDPSGDASISGGTEKVDFFVSTNAIDSDGFNLSDDFKSTKYEDGGTRNNSDQERQNLFANMGFQATDDLNFGLSFGYNHGEYGVPPSTIDAKKDSDNFAKTVKYDRVEDYEGYYTSLNVGYQVNDTFSLKSWAYYNDQEADNKRYDDDNYDTISDKGSYELTDKTKVAGATLQGTLDYDQYGSFTTSMHYENNEYDSDGYTIEKSGTEDVDISEELSLYSLAGEYNILLFDKLEVVGGYSHHWQDKDDGGNEDANNYLIGLSYDLTEDTRLRASYARKTRFASIKNLYDADAGNSDLSPEESDNYEIGITQQLPWDIEADLALFQNDVENYISKETDKDDNDVYQNHDEYQFRGLELTVAKYFEHALLQFGYSYLDSEDKATDDDLDYRPQHKLTLEGSYDFAFGLKCSGNIMYITDQYYYDNDGENKTEVGDITVVGLKFEQTLYKDTISVYTGVDNLFDEDYEESYAYPSQGRLVYAGLKVKF